MRVGVYYEYMYRSACTMRIYSDLVKSRGICKYSASGNWQHNNIQALLIYLWHFRAVVLRSPFVKFFSLRFKQFFWKLKKHFNDAWCVYVQGVSLVCNTVYFILNPFFKNFNPGPKCYKSKVLNYLYVQNNI